jgi:WD40 repeat protein
MECANPSTAGWAILQGYQIDQFQARSDGHTLISWVRMTKRFAWNCQLVPCFRKTIFTHVNWLFVGGLPVPDGTTLVTGSDHCTVKFWNLQTGECLGTLPDYTPKVQGSPFSLIYQLLATGSDDKR